MRRGRRRRRVRRPAGGGWCRRDSGAEAKTLGPSDEHKRKRQGAGGFDGGGHALHRVLELVDGLVRTPVASSMEPPTRPVSAARRIVSATVSGASPKPFSRSAATGRSVASTIIRALASVSSRVTAFSPSRRPRLNASPPLVVVSASKPRPASMRAVPASHGFGMTNAPGRVCNARKRSAFCACVTVDLDASMGAVWHGGRRAGCRYPGKRRPGVWPRIPETAPAAVPRPFAAAARARGGLHAWLRSDPGRGPGLQSHDRLPGSRPAKAPVAPAADRAGREGEGPAAAAPGRSALLTAASRCRPPTPPRAPRPAAAAHPAPVPRARSARSRSRSISSSSSTTRRRCGPPPGRDRSGSRRRLR